jgi:hypothetical protein
VEKMSLELLTPEVVDGWKRVATAQLENYRERIVIPTTLLLAMINKIQANEAKMNASERTTVYGIDPVFYTDEEVKLLMDDLAGRKKLDQDQWAMIVDAARKRMHYNQRVTDIRDTE